VVVCAYNAERTLQRCLESLQSLRYPNFEVIIVDDGSTDRTNAIAKNYPEFRLISHENRGLSVARNEGILAAEGAIVAFTDSDCEVDPDWLTYLVARLRSEELAGVGGTSLPPPEEDWVPGVVARSPGGPTHVLLTHKVAEHIPGCNMAFWRHRLLEVGLFDPIFRTAGDDVDICWRLQDAGHRIGFAPAALAWHRCRNTVSAYLRQQRGYGRAEALLSFKHPFRFNGLGHSRWLGRIYGGLRSTSASPRPVIYSGPFGEGLFQTLYTPPSSVWRHLPTTVEWNGAALGLVLLGLLSYLLGSGLPLLVGAGLALIAVSIGQAAYGALQADVNDLPRFRARSLLTLLGFAGPLARAVERYRERARLAARGKIAYALEQPQRPKVDLRRRRLVLSYWNETGIERSTCISTLVGFLESHGYSVTLDNGWNSWDFSVARGLSLQGQIQVLLQNHGEGRRQVDVGLAVRQTAPPRMLKGLYALGAAVAVAGGAWPVALAIGVTAIGTEAFLMLRARRLVETFRHAVDITFRSLPLDPLDSPPEARHPES
jgi:glycosyltransferase involved in cell wall biosynthesis